MKIPITPWSSDILLPTDPSGPYENLEIPSLNDIPLGGGAFRPLGPPVSQDFQGWRLDHYLGHHFRFLTRSAWKKRVETGLVQLNSTSVKPSSKVRLGDLIAMYAPPTREPPVDRRVRILWEEDGVMAIFKPAHLPIHENGPYRRNTLTQILWDMKGRNWSALHRLDRETSGVMLCGGTDDCRSQIAQDFEHRRIKKEYLAIARGVPSQDKWIADGPIGDLRESEIRIKKWVVADGLPAETHFEVEDLAPHACLLKVRPLTGRTNQIRIHAAHRGHVLFGDKLYHEDEKVFLEYFNRGVTKAVIDQAGFSRLCLHAYALEFTHPRSKKKIRIESPLPPDLGEFWQSLKYDSSQRKYQDDRRFMPPFRPVAPRLEIKQDSIDIDCQSGPMSDLISQRNFETSGPFVTSP